MIAAVREAFEETGILLARIAEDATNPGGREGLDIARRALLAEVVDLRQVIVTRSLRVSGDQLLYLAHWITPEPEPRRYDTRFFLARVDADAVCTPHEAEMTESVWLTARGAVHFFEGGSLKMLPPTVHTLRRLADYESVDEIFAALADAPVPAILPVMRVVPNGVDDRDRRRRRGRRGEVSGRNARIRPERMNSPLEDHEVRLRGLPVPGTVPRAGRRRDS